MHGENLLTQLMMKLLVHQKILGKIEKKRRKKEEVNSLFFVLLSHSN